MRCYFSLIPIFVVVPQHLNSLLEHYLEPMKKETFLSNSEVNALFGNIQEIVQFQRVFLQSLEEAIASEADFHRFDHPAQFKVSSNWLVVLFPMQNEEILTIQTSYRDQPITTSKLLLV